MRAQDAQTQDQQAGLHAMNIEFAVTITAPDGTAHTRRSAFLTSAPMPLAKLDCLSARARICS